MEKLFGLFEMCCFTDHWLGRCFKYPLAAVLYVGEQYNKLLRR